MCGINGALVFSTGSFEITPSYITCMRDAMSHRGPDGCGTWVDYDHRELRRELERTGRHRWRTDHCDTEVILHAFEDWGIDCLSRLRGMFAFALWDVRARALW